MAQLGRLPWFAQGHANDRLRRNWVNRGAAQRGRYYAPMGTLQAAVGPAAHARERTYLPPRVGALGCSPRDEVEDVPVLVLPELGFARMVLFSEFEDGP